MTPRLSFAAYWEAHCEQGSGYCWPPSASYGKDVVDDAPGDVPVVRLVSLHLGAPAQTTIPLNPKVSSTRGLNTPPRPLFSGYVDGDDTPGRIGPVEF